MTKNMYSTLFCRVIPINGEPVHGDSVVEQRIEPMISDLNQTKEKHLGIDNFIAGGRQDEKNVLPGVIDPKNLVLDDSRKQEIIRKILKFF
jgi:hypothetical protein